MSLTDAQIERGKQEVMLGKWYSLENIEQHHEHHDCIRIAYEWIDAQTKTKHPQETVWKSYVESWGERSVSTSDIDVAAYLHPDVKLKKIHPRDGSSSYILLNISKKIIIPSKKRLNNIREAFQHPSYATKVDWSKYKQEDDDSL